MSGLPSESNQNGKSCELKETQSFDGNFDTSKNALCEPQRHKKGLRSKIASLFKLAAPHGFEPRLTQSECAVLPLDDGAIVQNWSSSISFSDECQYDFS